MFSSLTPFLSDIEVRFKNNGLDLIEVQDNGSGISPNNYEYVGEFYTTNWKYFSLK